jgi:SAM-dependent methyltransferase
MTQLHETRLFRVPDLSLDIDGSNSVTIAHRGRHFRFGPQALPLLNAFASGSTLVEFLSQMSDTCPSRRKLELTVACAMQMVEAGILTDHAPSGFTDRTFPMGGYGAPYVHIRMLNDRYRKRLFQKAILEVAQPSDVVLDLGTGSGILAITAAKAGVKHVYAVEPTAIIEAARQAAKDNGVDDRITFIRAWAEDIDLPEKATLLTTDIIGNEPLEMKIWETIADARERLLAPDARLIPAHITSRVCLVEGDPEVIRQHRPDTEHVQRWREDFGIDFGAFLAAVPDRRVGFYIEPQVARHWQVLSDRQRLFDVDLGTDPHPFTARTNLTASSRGRAHGVLSYLEARLSPHTLLSTDPSIGGCPESHWFCPGAALKRPREVEAGTRISVRYEYHGEGRSILRPEEGGDSEAT